MGNKAVSPLADVTVSQASARLGANNLGHLEACHLRHRSANKPVVDIASFKAHVGPALGPAGPTVAGFLYRLLNTSRSNNLTLDEFVVGADTFERAAAEAEKGQDGLSIALAFALFDAKHAGSLDRADLAELLFVTTASSDDPPGLDALAGAYRDAQARPANGTGTIPDPPSPASSTLRSQGGSGGAAAAAAASAPTEFRPAPLLGTMAELVLSRFDADGDGRLALPEFAAFAASDPSVGALIVRLARWITAPLERKRGA